MWLRSNSRQQKGKSINDVPNEVIQKNIMSHLYHYDVKIFGMTCWRFKVIADDELEKRRKQRK